MTRPGLLRAILGAALFIGATYPALYFFLSIGG